MSSNLRGFTGIRMPGAKKYSASAMFKDSMKNGGLKQSQLTPEQRYKKVLEDKMEAMKKELRAKMKYQFTPPGTEKSEKQTSKGVEAFFKKMADIKAKQEAKKRRSQVTIVAKPVVGPQGGRVEANGTIRDRRGRVVGKINIKNGKIVDQRGITVGKYKPNSPAVEHKIARMIANSKLLRMGSIWQMAKPKSSLWGSANWGSAGGGGAWGMNGGGVYGNTGKNDSLW